MLVVKNAPANAEDIRDVGSIPELRRSPGGGHSNPLQYSCLENPMEEEPGGVQSMGLQRDGRDWSNLSRCIQHLYTQDTRMKRWDSWPQKKEGCWLFPEAWGLFCYGSWFAHFNTSPLSGSLSASMTPGHLAPWMFTMECVRSYFLNERFAACAPSVASSCPLCLLHGASPASYQCPEPLPLEPWPLG